MIWPEQKSKPNLLKNIYISASETFCVAFGAVSLTTIQSEQRFLSSGVGLGGWRILTSQQDRDRWKQFILSRGQEVMPLNCPCDDYSVTCNAKHWGNVFFFFGRHWCESCCKKGKGVWLLLEWRFGDVLSRWDNVYLAHKCWVAAH